VELETLKRAYAADLEDWDACLALVTAEIRRQFSQGATSVWLGATIRSMAEDLLTIDEEADWLDCGIGAEEIWEATARNLLTFCDFDWGCDHFSVLDFGGGVAFEAFDSNTERGLDDFEVEGEIDLLDLTAIRELAREQLRMALSIGDHLGRCPDDIRFASPVTGDDIRSTAVGLFVSSVSTAEECAEWMNDKGHGVWPVTTEEDRAALADAYLTVALGYPPTEYAVELTQDEGGGALLSELLESGKTDLDRISNELDAVRDELADRDATEPGR
jgi:hypothetical protein